ncbi:hypothetical protein CK203_089065 [Vitis vinifera]|uniref:Uncharacterized protein n=1 Tax=Vitis vinifera TaxID=29760 RepID=A0A438F5P2_VITVI|nr:hypothetical protein CK203_089065 [Vitis vinifera]
MVEKVFFALSELNGNKALVALRRVSSTLKGTASRRSLSPYLFVIRMETLRGTSLEQRVKNLEALALEFGCKVRMLQSAYLGLPLGAQHKSVAVCDGVKDRFQKRETLWKQVISRKFKEEEGGWSTREVREGFGVGFWKEIGKEGSLLQNKVVFSEEDSKRVSFWKDKWCGNVALCDSFPSLYALATFKEAWLVEL